MEKPTVLGVDIGGSHITAALVDLEKRAIVQKSIIRKAVDAKQDFDLILSAWAEVIKAAFGDDLTGKPYIGIAMPGPFDYENGISLIKDQDKFKSLFGVNVKIELAKKLKIEPSTIRFINDAAGFMLGEVFGGAAKGATNVFGLTLGTGLGSATALNGTAKDAALWNSKFKDGIAEDYLSSRWFIARYEELTGQKIDGVKELSAMQTDENGKKVFAEFGKNLADFLTPKIEEYQSELVILGGNIAQAYPLFETSLADGLKKNSLKTAIKITVLNEHAALIGAASCWDLVSE